MKLSNSAIDVYQTCSFKYKLQYINKLRPNRKPSAFHFGSSLDSALNHILLEKKENKTAEELDLLANVSYRDIFFKEWENTDINGKIFNIPTSPGKIQWTMADFDVSLLEEGDFERLSLLLNFALNPSNIYDFETDVVKMLKESKNVYGDLQNPHNLVCFLSMRRKGLLLLDAFKTDIMSQIEIVHGIQIPISLPNGEGDEIIGFADYDATFKDGVRRIGDNKTSSRAYTDEDITNSQQLALYSESLGNVNVAYSVLHKKLRKKAPIVRTQLIVGTISEELLEKTFDTVGEVEYNIKKERFEKNFDGCFSFGQKCPYFAYCRNGNLDNLECLRKEE